MATIYLRSSNAGSFTPDITTPPSTPAEKNENASRRRVASTPNKSAKTDSSCKFWKDVQKFFGDVATFFRPRRALDQIEESYFNPAPTVAPVAWTDVYSPLNTLLSLSNGNGVYVQTKMTQDDIRTDREVILFQPVRIHEEDGSITEYRADEIESLTRKILIASAERGVPIDKFDVLIRKEPLDVSRSDLDTTGKNTAEAMQGGMTLDQQDKLSLFGSHSDKTAYTFQLIPSNGRSQASGANIGNLRDILHDPAQLIKYVNPRELVKNVLRLKGDDWKDPQKIGNALLDSLWDGKTMGWQAALGAMMRMEGYVSQLFCEYTGGKPDFDETAQVAAHEGLTCHFVNLLDEYGSGEYTAQVKEYREKFSGQLDALQPQLEKWMSSDDTFKVLRFMAASGTTPDVIEFLNGISLKGLVQLAADTVAQAAADETLDISKTTRRALGLIHDNVLVPAVSVAEDTALINFTDILDADIVKAFARFEMTNVAFSPEELEANYQKFVAPFLHADSPYRRENLVIVEGGLQEKYGSYHFEYKKADGSPRATNAKDSHSANAPNSPFAEAVLEQMREGVPYAERVGQAPLVP